MDSDYVVPWLKNSLLYIKLLLLTLVFLFISVSILLIFPKSNEWSWLSRRQISYMMKNMLVLVSQACSILCDPMDCGPPGSSVHGILQARMLEWVAILFSRGSFWPRDQTQVSCIAGTFSTIWSTREAKKKYTRCSKT